MPSSLRGIDVGSGRIQFRGNQAFAGSTPLEDYFAGLPQRAFQLVGQTPRTINWTSTAGFAQDDWRVKPNITVSYGLRYESQNNIGDHADFAPRIGVAWGLDGNGKKSPKTVLRAGFGIFYDRFGYDLVLQQQRLNNITQQQFVVALCHD